MNGTKLISFSKLSGWPESGRQAGRQAARLFDVRVTHGLSISSLILSLSRWGI